MNAHVELTMLIFTLLSSSLFQLTLATGWDYESNGPDVWSDTYPLCNGHSQSPIVIQTACTKYQSFTSFNFTSTYDQTHDFILLNNGHTTVGTLASVNSSSLKLSGGGLNGIFEFVTFHLHWGENYRSGSEHRVNNRKYTGEIHFLHRNSETSQLAVLGFFIQSSQNIKMNERSGNLSTDNNDLIETTNQTLNEWKKYFLATGNLTEMNNSTVIRVNLMSLIGNHLDDFWRYDGSLTTPPCTEGVIWTIFKTPIALSEHSIANLRQMITFHGYRSPQPLYNRKIYRSFLNENISTIPDYRHCSNNSYKITLKLFLLIPMQLLLRIFITF